jgi:hypothetical protein
VTSRAATEARDQAMTCAADAASGFATRIGEGNGRSAAAAIAATTIATGIAAPTIAVFAPGTVTSAAEVPGRTAAADGGTNHGPSSADAKASSDRSTGDRPWIAARR